MEPDFHKKEVNSNLKGLVLLIDKLELALKNNEIESSLKQAKENEAQKTTKIEELELVISEMSKKLKSPVSWRKKKRKSPSVPESSKKKKIQTSLHQPADNSTHLQSHSSKERNQSIILS